MALNDEESYNVHKDKKKLLFADVQGEVLEIGPGTGVNFTFLKDKDIRWSGIEPNPAMYPHLYKAADEHGMAVNLLDCKMGEICLPDNSMDAVISTEVMCSVKDLDKCLHEIHRVLKPGSKFLFLEHVVDKKNFLRKTTQKAMPYTPWRIFAEGCRPARDIGKAIENSGFSNVEYTNYMQEGSGIITSITRPHIFGWAIK